MSMMKMLQQAQGGQGLSALASQFGLDEGKAQELSQMLAPAIGSAAKQRAEKGEAQDFLGALKGEGQAALFDDPAEAASETGQAQGASFLSNIFGGTDEAKGLAHEAANRTGVEPETAERFLPAMAAMLQGGMQKQMPDSALDGMMDQQSGEGGGASGLMGMASGLLGIGKTGGGGFDMSMLTSMLDADGDGSAMDDVLGKFMR